VHLFGRRVLADLSVLILSARHSFTPSGARSRLFFFPVLGPWAAFLRRPVARSLVSGRCCGRTVAADADLRNLNDMHSLSGRLDRVNKSLHHLLQRDQSEAGGAFSG
jgi:hypothetical protein